MLHFAVSQDLRDDLMLVLKKYHDELDVGNIEFSSRFRGPRDFNQSTSMDARFRLYGDKMLKQGNALQGAIKALPESVRQGFARRMLGDTWKSPDEFLADFDAILNTYGVSGSKVREGFYGITRSPEYIIQGMLDKGTFEVLDGVNRLAPKVMDDPSGMMPTHLTDLQGFFAARLIPADESLFTKMPSLDAFTQLAENSTGIKGLKNVIERVKTTPIPPRSNRTVDYSLGEVVTGETGGVDILMRDIKPSSEQGTPTAKVVEKERDIRFKNLPEPKGRNPLT